MRKTQHEQIIIKRNLKEESVTTCISSAHTLVSSYNYSRYQVRNSEYKFLTNTLFFNNLQDIDKGNRGCLLDIDKQTRDMDVTGLVLLFNCKNNRKVRINK